ncbi:hypothetical protein B6A27_03985 [Anoxybacillus sp. UARK-01]|uniref:CotD family spore coat protein n=1 Tax=Anoxybacteroides rupiense TaxID=311460 RepID=A0ABD5IRQ6_9BACL|nr:MULTISPECIES: CotD family spore coat protein [Anoxybacillus]MED5050563.1 CotD family spore coat protein [Anoxybacillus rupiensis]OQM46761.1 hypothetical protein B6A27_03985 [Anoxybacillus sp. UARK-01]
MNKHWKDHDEVGGVSDFGCNGSNNNNTEKTIVYPTRTIVNTTTNHHVIRRVHPTRIVNVTRDVYRVEDYYPTTVDAVNERETQYYDCGNDLNNPNCRRVGGASTGNGSNNNSGTGSNHGNKHRWNGSKNDCSNAKLFFE